VLARVLDSIAPTTCKNGDNCFGTATDAPAFSNTASASPWPSSAATLSGSEFVNGSGWSGFAPSAKGLLIQPIFARGNSRTFQRLKALRQEAQTDSATRPAGVIIQNGLLAFAGGLRKVGMVSRNLNWNFASRQGYAFIIQ